MAQGAKALVAKIDDLSPIPRTYKVEKREQLRKLSCDLHMYTVAHTRVHKYSCKGYSMKETYTWDFYFSCLL